MVKSWAKRITGGGGVLCHGRVAESLTDETERLKRGDFVLQRQHADVLIVVPLEAWRDVHEMTRSTPSSALHWRQAKHTG
jgi:hypothetical protein